MKRGRARGQERFEFFRSRRAGQQSAAVRCSATLTLRACGPRKLMKKPRSAKSFDFGDGFFEAVLVPQTTAIVVFSFQNPPLGGGEYPLRGNSLPPQGFDLTLANDSAALRAAATASGTPNLLVESGF